MLKIPFYKNTADNTHCFQAVLKSIFKFYFPKKNYSFAFLDRISAHKKDKWTWISAAFIFLVKKGFKIIHIENFDYKKFALLGKAYLQKFWTDEVYQTQKKFSDIKNEQKLAKLLVKNKNIKLIKRSATLKNIKHFYKNKYILSCAINPYVLKKQKGFASHLIIITNLTKNRITFHDPGLPPQKHRTVPLKLFFRALRYPTKRDANLTAIKLIKTKIKKPIEISRE